MSDNSTKYILNLLESAIPRQLQTIIEDMLFSIETTTSEEISYEFVLIDNMSTEYPPESKVIYFGKTKDKKSFFEKGGVAILSADIVDSETELTYFKRLLGENSTLDVADSLQTNLKALGHVKVTDHLNSGYYCDSIAVKAAEEGFKFLNIKKGIFNLFSLISDLIFDDKGEFPVDVDFGVSDRNFFIQSHFPVQNFYSDIIWDLLSDEKGPFSLMIDSAKTIDIYTLGKTEKLAITISWTKEESVNKSLYIHSIDSFRPANRKTNLSKVKTLKLNHNKELELNLPKNKKTPLSLSSISRIVTFLKQQKVDLDKITISNITDYLSLYPNKSVVASLGTLEKEDILKMIKDQEMQNEVSSLVENEKKVLSENVLENFINKVEGLNLEDASEIVSLGLEDYTEPFQRVSGWMDEIDESVEIVRGTQEDIGEDSILVKGSKASLDEGSVTVKGEREDIGTDNERLDINSSGEGSFSANELPKWRTAKDLLISNLKKKIENKEITNHSELESELSQLLQNQINMSEEESRALSSGILNESVIDSYESEPSLEEKNIEDQVRLKDAMAKKDIQISRMMKLIDAMKKELLVKVPTSDEISNLKNDAELKRLQTEIENKNTQIEALSKNVEILNSKQGNESPITAAPLGNVEVKSYEAKIRTLETMLDEAKQRSELLNEKLEKEREEYSSRAGDETIQFREKMMKSQKVINTFQKENKELLLEIEKLKAVQDELSSVTTESSSVVDTHLVDEKEKEIETLNLELKKESDQSKGLGLKIKQLEQKNKFLLAQIDEASRGMNKGKGAGKSPGDAKLQHKIKHLEKLSNNFKSEAETAKLELAEKKKEVHKAKLESNLLKSKVTELERKLAINKKKVA